MWYTLSKISVRIRHTFSSQPYGRRFRVFDEIFGVVILVPLECWILSDGDVTTCVTVGCWRTFEGTWNVRSSGCLLNQVCMCCVAGARFEPPDPPLPGASGLCLGEALEQLVTVLQQAPLLPPPPDHATTCLLLQWLQVRFILHSNRPCSRISVSFVCHGFLSMRLFWNHGKRH